MITTAFVLAFSQDHRLLQTHLVRRGWDIVGGHIEPGESPAQAVIREAYEEAGVNLEHLHLLGYQRLRVLCTQPVTYRYPYPESYQIFYRARIASFEHFTATRETRGYDLFSPSQAEQLPWIQKYKSLYLAALSALTAEAQ